MSRSLVYVPDVSNCYYCKYADRKCNKYLNFKDMEVISSDCRDPGVEILKVVCNGFVRDPEPRLMSSRAFGISKDGTEVR